MRKSYDKCENLICVHYKKLRYWYKSSTTLLYKRLRIWILQINDSKWFSKPPLYHNKIISLTVRNFLDQNLGLFLFFRGGGGGRLTGMGFLNDFLEERVPNPPSLISSHKGTLMSSIGQRELIHRSDADSLSTSIGLILDYPLMEDYVNTQAKKWFALRLIKLIMHLHTHAYDVHGFLWYIQVQSRNLKGWNCT